MNKRANWAELIKPVILVAIVLVVALGLISLFGGGGEISKAIQNLIYPETVKEKSDVISEQRIIETLDVNLETVQKNNCYYVESAVEMPSVKLSQVGNDIKITSLSEDAKEQVFGEVKGATLRMIDPSVSGDVYDISPASHWFFLLWNGVKEKAPITIVHKTTESVVLDCDATVWGACLSQTTPYVLFVKVGAPDNALGVVFNPVNSKNVVVKYDGKEIQECAGNLIQKVT